MAASEFCKSMSALIKSILRLLIVLDPLKQIIIIIIAAATAATTTITTKQQQDTTTILPTGTKRKINNITNGYNTTTATNTLL